MNFNDWMDATNAKAKGISLTESKRRSETRMRVIKKAGTTSGTLRVAKCRGKIGDELLQRLVAATADEDLKITESAEQLRREAARPPC